MTYRYRLFMIPIIILMLTVPAFPGRPAQKGFQFVIGNNGTGVGGFYSKRAAKTGQYEFEGSIYWVKETLPAVDYWGNPLPNQGKHLFFVPLKTGYQFLLFTKSLAETFYPTISILAGPNIFFDLGEQKSMKKRWDSADIGVSYTLYIGAGAQFVTGPRNIMRLSFGYTFFKFSKNLDNKRDYSTVCLKLQFGFG